MHRRWTYLLCSLWLLGASLLPGTGWALCVGAEGHVAVEAVSVGTGEHSRGESDPGCRENCMADACDSCHDVQLESIQLTSARRDLSAPAPTLLAAGPGFAAPYPNVPTVMVVHGHSPRVCAAPHLACVLRR
jgi:hypothetical protein